ncbi:MAG: ribosome small subunit-dependent GTPase A [Lachnospiraceae bacterium]|nr:ribosome small subunit-dependent GTPase A [Lachnospiraceae bacterium]
MNNIFLRKENKEDYYNTEHMVLRAFWNIHDPGCNEHLLVHKLRESPDYLPELSRVAEIDGKIAGAIFASKAKVVDNEKEHEVLTFGPLAVEPSCFSMGVGKALTEELIKLSREEGYSGIVICGEPGYYPRLGFKTCDLFGIIHPDFGNSDAFMAYPLNESFEEIHGTFFESPVFAECEDEEEIREYTKNFPYYKPLKLSAQWLHKERLGRICEVRKNSFKIRFFEEELRAKLKGSFYEDAQKNYPLVGDYVTFLYNRTGDSTILSVCERTSTLKRPDQAKTAVMQYMVANADYTFIVTSLNDDYSFNRIARYASIAFEGNSIPVVILTKSDLCNNVGRYVSEVETISEKIRVHAVSAILDIGLDELEEYFEPGNTICLMGSSGAGKSTLINAIAKEEIMKTSEIREDDSKGRHTTTHRQMIVLKNGVCVIDTPGMREVGMAENEDGIDNTFSDIRELERYCKFSNCRHESEPGCAIKEAIESGKLSRKRYELFKNLGEENRRNHAMKKEISMLAKEYKKFNPKNR